MRFEPSGPCSLVDEHTIRYGDPSYLDDSPDGVKNESPCIYKGTSLGNLVVRSSDLGRTVTFSSEALRQFLHQPSVTTTTPQRFTGNLKLPLLGGQYITLPGGRVVLRGRGPPAAGGAR